MTETEYYLIFRSTTVADIVRQDVMYMT